MPVGGWPAQDPNCPWSCFNPRGLSTESCALPENRGNCSKLNKGTWIFTCPALSSGPFTWYRFVYLYLSILKAERELPRRPCTEPPSVHGLRIRGPPPLLLSALLPRTWRAPLPLPIQATPFQQFFIPNPSSPQGRFSKDQNPSAPVLYVKPRIM